MTKCMQHRILILCVNIGVQIPKCYHVKIFLKLICLIAVRIKYDDIKFRDGMDLTVQISSLSTISTSSRQYIVVIKF